MYIPLFIQRVGNEYVHDNQKEKNESSDHGKNCRMSMNAGVVTTTLSCKDLRESLPLYGILEFLKWPMRFAAYRALRFSGLDPFEDQINSKWVNGRLVAETLFIAPVGRTLTQADIIHIGGSLCFGKQTDKKRLKSTVVYGTQPAECLAERCNRDSRLYIHIDGLLDHRVEASSLSSLTKGYVKHKARISIRESKHPRSVKLEVDRVCLLNAQEFIDYSSLNDFINGANLGLLIVGSRPNIPKIISSLLDTVDNGVASASKIRRDALGPHAYECVIESSIYRSRSDGLRQIWSTSGAPLGVSLDTTKVKEVLDTDSFTCIQIILVHYFTQPELGAYQNVLTIVLDPPARTESLIAKRDRFALSRCLSAIQSGSKHIPYRECRLTRLLELQSISEFHVIAAVDSDVPTDPEAAYALRFIKNTFPDVVYT